MGVPYYFYQIYKKYNKDVKLTIDEHDIFSGTVNVDVLFFDYNSMIHPIAHKTIERLDGEIELNDDIIENNIIDDCLSYTRYVLSILKPASIYIMIDGVAPLAKIKQQRERRYKSLLLKQTDCTTGLRWDTNNITPGTHFMSKLSDSLKKFEKQIGESCYINVSTSDDPGEGEHKMMKIINTLSSDLTIGIYGLDADLIMLSLLKSAQRNIILLRDNSFNIKLQQSERTFMYVNVKKLFASICKEIRGYGVQFNDIQIIQDYIFICFFLGNDFLHHIPSIKMKDNGMQKLVKAYVQSVKHTQQPITNDTTINWITFKQFVYNCYMFEKQSKLYQSHWKDTIEPENCTNNDYNIHFYKEDIIKFQDNGYKRRYYTYYGIYDKVDHACKNYIQGLQWILGYYSDHCHNNWNWCYEFAASPFFEDLYNYTKNCIPDLTFISNYPMNSTQQLLMVLPKESLYNILERVNSELCEQFKRLMRTTSLEILQNYPQDLSLDLFDKEYLWQSTIFFGKFQEKFIHVII